MSEFFGGSLHFTNMPIVFMPVITHLGMAMDPDDTSQYA